MKRIKESLKDQGVMFADHYIGDRLSEDDEVYLFDMLIDKLNISSVTNSYSEEGGSMFEPRDKLAVVLYAFHKGITSSIAMTVLTQMNLRFIYLAGGHIIKRKTFSDFRLKHKESIKKIFASSIELAVKAGLIQYDDLFAVDGSKFEANASFSNTRRKVEWKERQEKIVEHVDNFLCEWEEQDLREEDLEEKEKEEFNRIRMNLNEIKNESRNKKIAPKEKTSIDIDDKPEEPNTSAKEDVEPIDTDDEPDKPDASAKEDVESIDTDDKPGKPNASMKEAVDGSTPVKKKKSKAVYKKNRITIKKLADADKFIKEYKDIDFLLDEYKSVKDEMLLSLTDPDCRIMKSDSISKECYNVQAISNNQVIVAVDVTQDENDQAQLEPMVEQLKNNIDMAGKKIKFAGDAGYNRGKNLAYIDQQDEIDPYISMFDRSGKNESETSKFNKENFTFDEEDDSWICPTGERLGFIKEYICDNKKFTLYGCRLEKCVHCPNNSFCISTKADRKRGYRTIDDDGYIVYRKEMRDKMTLDESKKIYSGRSGSVEPVFGQIKYNRGFTRFRLKGLSKVKAEFLIMATAHNLGKIMKHLRLNKEKMQLNVCEI